MGWIDEPAGDGIRFEGTSNWRDCLGGRALLLRMGSGGVVC